VPRDRYRNEILDALNGAGAPLTAQELAARLDVKGHQRRLFDAALAALERAGEVVQNRAGALLVAKRIALLAGRIEAIPTATVSSSPMTAARACSCRRARCARSFTATAPRCA